MENLLPKEIMIDIISRLPFELVLECRGVSKTWRSLIYHPSFAHLHLQRSGSLQQLDQDDDDDDDDDDENYKDQHFSSNSASSKVGFLSLQLLDGNCCQLLYLEYDEKVYEYLSVKGINHPPIQNYKPIVNAKPCVKQKHTTAIVGSCNGLLCLSILDHGLDEPLYICNPITREYVNLPILNTQNGSKGRIVFGFGYHPKISKYKVARIYYAPDEPSVGLVQVYTLGAGTGWRNIGEINHSLQSNKNLSPSICADGYLYWQVENGVQIVGFNLSDEEFQLLPKPPIFTDCGNVSIACYQYIAIQVLGGCLCFLMHDGMSSGELYSFKKKSWSWIKECTVCTNPPREGCRPPFMCDPFALTRSGDVLLWYYRKFVLRYDPRAETFVKYVGHRTTANVYETIPHVNSFVSLKSLGEEDVRIFERIN